MKYYCEKCDFRTIRKYRYIEHINIDHANMLSKFGEIKNTTQFFVHIPKNAGTSFILKYVKQNYGHRKIINIDNIDIVKNTVAIVRNPFDRLLSIYTYTKTDSEKLYWKNKEVLYDYCNTHTFKEFIDALYTNKIKKSDQVHLSSQIDYLRWKDNKIYSKLARFDHLENDLSNILGIKISLEKINASDRKECWSDYYDKDDIKKVKHIYKEDLNLYSALSMKNIHYDVEKDDIMATFNNLDKKTLKKEIDKLYLKGYKKNYRCIICNSEHNKKHYMIAHIKTHYV